VQKINKQFIGREIFIAVSGGGRLKGDASHERNKNSRNIKPVSRAGSDSAKGEGPAKSQLDTTYCQDDRARHRISVS
jgi:hypothetical protein